MSPTIEATDTEANIANVIEDRYQLRGTYREETSSGGLIVEHGDMESGPGIRATIDDKGKVRQVDTTPSNDAFDRHKVKSTLQDGGVPLG